MEMICFNKLKFWHILDAMQLWLIKTDAKASDLVAAILKDESSIYYSI